MEADWEVEIGGDAPVIDACWSGYVDLRQAPERAVLLPEAAELPALGFALAALNAPESSFFTVKCDLWPLEEIDPIEFDAPLESAVSGLACYIDLVRCINLVRRETQLWTDPQTVIAWCKKLCTVLKSSTLPCGRVDLIVRRVHRDQQDDHGVTIYISACGASQQLSKTQLALALKTLTESIHAGWAAESSTTSG